MDRNDFIAGVQKYAQLQSREQALSATEAVLETLGECLYRTECNGLAAQLPKGIKELLFKKHPPEQSRRELDRISLEEFYNRVHARSELGYNAAVNASLAVATVLKQAIAPGEIADAVAELPSDLRQLFT